MAAPRPACALSALALVAGLVGCDDSAPTDAERGGLESMATRDAAVPDAGSDAGGDAGADAGRGALELPDATMPSVERGEASPCANTDCSHLDDACMRGLCDPSSGGCLELWLPDGTACGDEGESPCDHPDSCQDGMCAANHVEAGAVCGDAYLECHLPDTCDGAGVCQDRGVQSEGSACGDDSASECDQPDSCDGRGRCQDNHAGQGSACGDAAGECVVADSCDGRGQCRDMGFVAAGAPCGDGTDVECNGADSCDGAGSCMPNHSAAGTACGSASEGECDAADSCDGLGSCLRNHSAAGTPCGDAGDSACDHYDRCDGSGSCDSAQLQPGAVCDDQSDPCAAADLCDVHGGTCIDRGPQACATVAGHLMLDVQPVGGGVLDVVTPTQWFGAVANADSSFELVVPASQLLELRSSAEGHYNTIQAWRVPMEGTTDAFLNVYSQAGMDDAIQFFGWSQDPDLGVIFTIYWGASGSGGEGMLVNRPSEIPWVLDGAAIPTLSTTLVAGGVNSNIVHSNVEPGPLEITPIAPEGRSCVPRYPDYAYRAEAGTMTLVEMLCGPAQGE